MQRSRRYIVATTAAFVPLAAVATGQAVQPVEFVERPGVMEFSGRMNAKPVNVQQAPAVDGAARRNLDLQVAAALAQIDPFVIHYEPGMDTYTFVLPEGTTEAEVATELMATGAFEWVEPDWYVYPSDCPNDPLFGNQWHHINMESCDAYAMEVGIPEMIVAVCDTGVNVNHEDLRGRNVPGYNAPDRRSEAQGGSISDINNHGTWVAGCAAAIGDNGIGVSGVCQDISYMPIRVTNSGGGGAYQSDINNGVLWAVDNGAQIANVSYSGVESSSVASLGNSVAQRGALLVYAGGNEGRRLGQRQWDSDEVITVSASTSSDRKAGFSNYGPIMDVIAPGAYVRTTDRRGGYASVSGTSFAAPVTAGLCALIWSTNPSMSREEVYDALINGVDDLGSPGWDETYASGRVNSRASIEMLERFRLETNDLPLQGGSRATFDLVNGDPNTQTGLFYSIRGEGSTFVPALGVSVDLQNAQAAGPIQNTNGQGSTSWTLNVPSPRRVVLVWIQGAQSSGTLTEVTLTQLNP